MKIDEVNFVAKLYELSKAVKNKELTNKDFVNVQNRISQLQKTVFKLGEKEASKAGFTRQLNETYEELKTVKNAMEGYVSVNFGGQIYKYKPSYIESKGQEIYKEIESKFIKDIDEKLKNDPANLKYFNALFHNPNFYDKSKSVKNWYELADQKIKEVIERKNSGKISEGKAYSEIKRLTKAIERVDKKIIEDYGLTDNIDPNKDVKDYQDTDETDKDYYTIVSTNSSTVKIEF